MEQEGGVATGPQGVVRMVPVFTLEAQQDRFTEPLLERRQEPVAGVVEGIETGIDSTVAIVLILAQPGIAEFQGGRLRFPAQPALDTGHPDIDSCRLAGTGGFLRVDPVDKVAVLAVENDQLAAEGILLEGDTGFNCIGQFTTKRRIPAEQAPVAAGVEDRVAGNLAGLGIFKIGLPGGLVGDPADAEARLRQPDGRILAGGVDGHAAVDGPVERSALPGPPRHQRRLAVIAG